MKKIRVHRKGYHRKGYTRKGGIRVKPAYVPPTSYLVRDRGKAGRTPKSKQWFNPKTHTGWSKYQKQLTRIKHLKKGGVSNLTAARRAMALSNVTTDPTTKRLARSDALLLYARHRKK